MGVSDNLITSRWYLNHPVKPLTMGGCLILITSRWYLDHPVKPLTMGGCLITLSLYVGI